MAGRNFPSQHNGGPRRPVTSTADSTGKAIFPDNYAHVLTYNTDGTLATDAFTDTINTWTQTLTYTAGRLTGISKWVKS